MLTLHEVAKRLNLHYNTVYYYVRTGQLKAMKLEMVYRIEERELEKFIEDRTFKFLVERDKKRIQ